MFKFLGPAPGEKHTIPTFINIVFMLGPRKGSGGSFPQICLVPLSPPSPAPNLLLCKGHWEDCLQFPIIPFSYTKKACYRISKTKRYALTLRKAQVSFSLRYRGKILVDIEKKSPFFFLTLPNKAFGEHQIFLFVLVSYCCKKAMLKTTLKSVT